MRASTIVGSLVRLSVLSSGVIATWSSACGGSDASIPGGHPEGTEGGSCLAGRSCDSGLVCLSNVCVKDDRPDATPNEIVDAGGGDADSGPANCSKTSAIDKRCTYGTCYCASADGCFSAQGAIE